MGLGVSEFLDDNEDFILNRKPPEQKKENKSNLENQIQKVIQTARNAEMNNLSKSSDIIKHEKAIKTQSFNTSFIKTNIVDNKQKQFSRLDLIPSKGQQLITSRSEASEKNYQIKHQLKVSLQQGDIKETN